MTEHLIDANAPQIIDFIKGATTEMKRDGMLLHAPEAVQIIQAQTQLPQASDEDEGFLQYLYCLRRIENISEDIIEKNWTFVVQKYETAVKEIQNGTTIPRTPPMAFLEEREADDVGFSQLLDILHNVGKIPEDTIRENKMFLWELYAKHTQI